MNFYLCVERSKTEYVWVFSDDDLMELNAINEVFKYLNSDYNLIIANYSVKDYYLKKELRENYLDKSINSKLSNHDIVMSNFGFRLSFLSCLIFKRSDFLKIKKSIYKKFVKYHFPFLLNIYLLIFKNCRLYFIKNTILIQRGNFSYAEINWWYKIFVSGSKYVFDYLKNHGYSPKSVKIARKKMIMDDIIPDIFYRKINNENILSQSTILIKNLYNFPFELFLVLIIIITPAFILKSLKKIKKLF